MQSIHISTIRKMLQAPEPVDIKCWAKDGRIFCPTVVTLQHEKNNIHREYLQTAQ